MIRNFLEEAIAEPPPHNPYRYRSVAKPFSQASAAITNAIYNVD